MLFRMKSYQVPDNIRTQLHNNADQLVGDCNIIYRNIVNRTEKDSFDPIDVEIDNMEFPENLDKSARRIVKHLYKLFKLKGNVGCAQFNRQQLKYEKCLEKFQNQCIKLINEKDFNG
ncbi:hypothetical protein WR164_02400 [Philodulcilactobacillus myokoensis]|uniref:Uncharacterized protein n=1 Tax=Philodulcilactobacillus myokoensis TaxID=2929573 RepID=A0A9W6B0D1_9LACO|nr:hypothetical protein [Philodulcilactobacillus myokoensis]GLB46261.1 hypothetical protein WR164_02400 [Philodulcilactobacillus myokoensis]